MNKVFQENIELPFELLKQFCQPCEAKGDGETYQAKRLPLLSFNQGENRLKYASLWNDFVLFRINHWKIL